MDTNKPNVEFLSAYACLNAADSYHMLLGLSYLFLFLIHVVMLFLRAISLEYFLPTVLIFWPLVHFLIYAVALRWLVRIAARRLKRLDGTAVTSVDRPLLQMAIDALTERKRSFSFLARGAAMNYAEILSTLCAVRDRQGTEN